MKKLFTPAFFILIATLTQAQHTISFQTPPEQATLFAERTFTTTGLLRYTGIL